MKMLMYINNPGPSFPSLTKIYFIKSLKIVLINIAPLASVLLLFMLERRQRVVLLILCNDDAGVVGVCRSVLYWFEV